jgi:hypothetical protein
MAQDSMQEEDIRRYIEAWLKQQGISTEREVTCGNGVRADLVTPDTVIEIKKQLNRGSIYQAYGQGVAYQNLLKKPKLMIIGFAPASETRYQEAQRIAENVQTENVQVVFIDKDPQWGLAVALTSGAQPPLPPALKLAKSALPDLPPDLKAAAKSAAKSAQTGGAQLPFEIAAAATEGSGGEGSGGGGKETGQEATKEAKSSAQSSDKPAALISKDIWILLLIILLFLWIRAYFWRPNPSYQTEPQIPAPSLSPSLDPPSPEFTVPWVPQK